MGDLPLPRLPAVEEVVEEAGAKGIGDVRRIYDGELVFAEELMALRL